MEPARSGTPCAWLACCVLLAAIEAASAQTVSIQPADAKRWDVTGSIGWLAGNKSELGEDWNDWYDTFATSLDVGRYWTPHLKTDVGFVFTTEGEVVSHEERLIPGQRFSIFIPREHHFRVNALNASMTYQFFDNAWVHPFLTAGVQFAEERERALSMAVPFFGSDQARLEVPLPAPQQATVSSVRPFALGGAKFYVNERGFVRTDLGLAWHKGRVGQITWRIGIGVDF
jgi:opacity protein-like surface antigen